MSILPFVYVINYALLYSLNTRGTNIKSLDNKTNSDSGIYLILHTCENFGKIKRQI